jgi:hypothetical protein
LMACRARMTLYINEQRQHGRKGDNEAKGPVLDLAHKFGHAPGALSGAEVDEDIQQEFLRDQQQRQDDDPHGQIHPCRGRNGYRDCGI